MGSRRRWGSVAPGQNEESANPQGLAPYMNSDEFLYLTPYVAALLLAGGIFLYTWQRRQVRGARAYAWFVGGQALYIFGFIFELISPCLETKILWDKLQWVAETMLVTVSFVAFAVRFSEYRFRRPALAWSVLLLFPAGFAILLLTDPIHHLIYPNPHLALAGPFSQLEYDFTNVVYAYALYIYASTLFGIGLLVRRILRPPNLYRLQAAAIAVGFAIPVLLSLLTLLDIRITLERDSGPLSFSIGNLIIAWALFRYRVFEIVPIAREAVIEHIQDPVVVTDEQDRIVDINPAMLANIGLQDAGQVIGQPVETVFSAWSDLIQRFRNIRETHAHVVARIKGRKRYFELSISPLYEHRGSFIGRVFVSREITGHVRLENRLKRLNSELERRVEERTADLAEAYDTTLEGWAKALEFRDKETEGHSRRVTELTLRLSRALGISERQLVQIRRGALLHDIGKMAIPDEILRKNEALSNEEKVIVARHPRFAYELLAPIPYLREALEIPYCHHEHWDGSGYPRGLRGEEIPLSARIFTVIDVWDALQSDRPYRRPWSRAKTLRHLRRESGKLFDPVVIEAFLSLVEQGEV